MVKIVVEDLFDWPAGYLFELVADPLREHLWDNALIEVEKLTPGPLAKGTHYRGQFKGLGSVEFTFVDFDEGHHFVREATLPFGVVRHRFQFHPARGGGTQIVQTIQIQRRGIWNYLVPVLSFFGKRRMERIFADLEDAVAQQEHARTGAP